MLVFIDESGDSGMKIKEGSSRFFTIGLVVFEDYDDATACDQRIQLLKKEIAFAQENFDENAALKELAQKCRIKYKNVEPLKRKQRIFSYLARRGFSIEAIQEALNIYDS